MKTILTIVAALGLTSCAYYQQGSSNNSVSTIVQPQYNAVGYGGGYAGWGYGPGYYPYGCYGGGGYYGWGWGGGYWGRGCGWGY